MTETYLQKLTKERVARLSRIAKASIEQELPPAPAPTKIDIKQEEEEGLEQVIHRKEVEFKDIFKAVCRHYGVSMLDIISARRHGRIVLARHVIAHIAFQHTKCSIRIIASRLARDSSTIVYALERMKTLVQTDSIAADIAKIKKALGL